MIKTELVGSDAVVAKLDQLPDLIHKELMTGIGRAALKLARDVQQNRLSGQVLNVKTGRLRRSIRDVVEESGDKVTGIVSTPVKYAAFHEYGFSGTEDVREHLRRSKAQYALRKVGTKGRETAASARKWEGKGEIVVRAHTRHVDYPAHSFLRSALADLESQGVIREEIENAIARAKA